MQGNVIITNRNFWKAVFKKKTVYLDSYIKEDLVQGTFYRRTSLVTLSTRFTTRSNLSTRLTMHSTGWSTRGTCLPNRSTHVSFRSTRLFTRSTHLPISSTSLSTRSICLSTCSTCSSTIFWSFDD